MPTKAEILLEYARCVNDTPYALKTYLQTFDNTQSKFVPLDLFDDQITLVNNYESNDENIALKYRQAGVSTVTAAWISKRLITAPKTKPERILVIANKLDTAVEMADSIKDFLKQWPSWFGVDFTREKNAQKHYKLTNGCQVKAVATSKDALRGYTPTMLIFDEAAYIEAEEGFWGACMAALSTGGEVVVISTPNGFDPIYYTIYNQAMKGMNDFKITELTWYKDPRYTKDFKLIKTNDIIHYMLNREDYIDEDITIDYSHIPPKERDFEEIKEKIKGGYKAYSSWFEKMAKKYKFNKRTISQELESDFLGSGDNVIPPEIRERIKENDICEPINKFMGGTIWQWKEPVEGHKYIMAIDVSRGDSEDYTAFNIIDFDAREQVLEYVGKIPPDVAGEISYKWATMYSAFVVIDITGGMGISTSRKLQEMGYKDLYVEGVNTMDKWKYNPKTADKIPGLNFNAKRVQIIAALEEALRHDFTIHSQRLMAEIETFIYHNGRPDHMKGHHDDSLIAMGMGIYVAENSFTELNKVTQQTKAMIDSWSVNETPVNNRGGGDFNPGVPVLPGRIHEQRRYGAVREDYIRHSWLFGR